MRLGELVWPDRRELRDYRKVTMRHSVKLFPTGFGFTLPGHKADRFFEGNEVLVNRVAGDDDPDAAFRAYLASRDARLALRPELWLEADGTIPTRSWFISRLRRHFGSNVSGHSLRAGGATALAAAGVPPHIIQAMGRWSSDTFQIYIRKHPAVLAALLYALPPQVGAAGAPV